MTVQDIISYLRVNLLRDFAVPYLWSDDVLVLYINEAYTQFCRDTHYMQDSTAYSITLSPGEATYDLSTDILLVKSMRVTGAPGELQNWTRRALPPDNGAADRPVAFALDELAWSVRFYPVPAVAEDVTIRCVVALPTLTESDTPAIPERYHRGLADGVAALCHEHNDSETLSNPAADRHKEKFERFIAAAKRDTYRYRMGNSPSAVQNWTGKR